MVDPLKVEVIVPISSSMKYNPTSKFAREGKFL
jgi:hypothetical protein